MHLASEVVVSSTTNSATCDKSAATATSSTNNNNNNNNNARDAPLTAENLAERTIDGLLAEHPGELVRTGCPHVVRRSYSSSRYLSASISSELG